MGEEVIIAHDREPVARLIALTPPQVQRTGLDEGKHIVPDSFNEPTTKDGSDLFPL